jgi:hypothetical protein
MATVAVAHLPQVRDVVVILREFVRPAVAEAAEGGDVDIAEIVELAERHFAGDEELMTAAVRDAIRAIVPDIVRMVVKRTPDLVPVERGAISGKRLEKTSRERLASMFESLGDGHYRSVLTMRGPELDAVIADRESQVAGQVRQITVLKALRQALPNDTTPVSKIPASKLNAILSSYFEPGE